MLTTCTVPVPDGSLHVVHGGRGPDLVLLHPGAMDHTVWDEVATDLTADHHVIRHDARSHGRSSTAMTDHSPAADLLAVLDALGVDRAHLVGCSMGGLTASETAVTHPDRVATLVMTGADVWPLHHDEDAFLRHWTGEQAAAIEARSADRWVEALLRYSVDGPRREPGDVDAGLRERCRAIAERAVRNHGTATGAQLFADVRDRLAEVTAPTLVVDADLDLAPLHDTADLLEHRVPDVRRVDLAGIGHLAMLEAPETLAGLVRDHVAGRADR